MGPVRGHGVERGQPSAAAGRAGDLRGGSDSGGETDREDDSEAVGRRMVRFPLKASSRSRCGEHRVPSGAAPRSGAGHSARRPGGPPACDVRRALEGLRLAALPSGSGAAENAEVAGRMPRGDKKEGIRK